MKDLPHLYRVKTEGSATSILTSHADNLPNILVAPPAQFGGPGDHWSPENLLMASVANCLVLSFKAIARASGLEWITIECESVGTLERVERKTQFTDVLSKVKLCIPTTQSKEKAERLLMKAEDTCFISNSMTCESRIECEINFSES